jgi:hypothetical protein
MSLTDKLIKKAFGKLQSYILKFRDFLKKPLALIALNVAAFAIMTPFLNWLKGFLPSNSSDEDIQNYIKKNRDIQNYLNYIGEDINDSVISDIVLACNNPDYYEDQVKKLKGVLSVTGISGEDYIKIAQQQSDFDNKTDAARVSNDLSKIIKDIEGTLPWMYLIYVIILKIQEFLTQNEHPSPFRGKYLQRLIRTTSIIIKNEINNQNSLGNRIGKNELNKINNLLSILKSLDAIIIGGLMASFVYLQNRKLLQEDAIRSFNEISKEQGCITPSGFLTDEETSPSSTNPLDTSLGLGFSCPVSLDTDIVPHIPIEEKIDQLTCEIPFNEDGSINEKAGQDIATKALYENKSDKKFKITVKRGDKVDSKKIIATYDGDNVYSSVTGIVDKVETNKIYIKDIGDPENTYLGELIQKSQDDYKELNELKFFLKDFYLETSYPVMLRNSPMIDGSVNDTEKIGLLFRTDGVKGRWNSALNRKKSQNAQFEKDAKNISSSKNIKTKAENDQLDSIRVDLEKAETTLFEELKADEVIGINQSKVTLPILSEFNLIEYYFKLSEDLLAYYDQNNTVKSFLKIILGFLRDRYFIDQYNLEKIQGLIQDYCKKLSEGQYYNKTPNFYSILKDKFDNTKAAVGQKNKAPEDYLKSLGSKNRKLTETEKTSIINTILFLFRFTVDIEKLVSIKFSTKKTPFEATDSEGLIIEGFFNNLWKRYDALPIEIEAIYKEMDNISLTFTTYSIINIDGEEYRYYGIGQDRTCPIPIEEDEYLSPYSKSTYGDIKYWLKYCGFATLASVANPATGWSTGFPPPIGPLLLPTVYIPFKAFQLPWGFIVVGLTITGIYPFPWALFVNYSTGYHVPLADPATIIQREVSALKKEITKQLNGFKKNIVKSYLDKTKVEIADFETQLVDLEDQKRTHKLVKPKRNRKIDPIVDIPNYLDNLSKWEINGAAIEEQILTTKTKKWQSETKYKIIKDISDGIITPDNVDAKIKSIQSMEKSINSQFDKLDALVAKIDLTLAPLPIATKPETANFAFTLKNPKPIIKMADDIDDVINNGPLDKVLAKFELKNEDLMKSSYSPVLSSSINNFKSYKKALKIGMPAIIKADPFPKYENLKPSNLPWMAFLLKSWTPTGAQTYGIPGFSPPPIG